MNLPAPAPVAIRITRHGLFYEADIMTNRIPDTCTLAELLSKNPLDTENWKAIGRCIRDFHDGKVYHADLNANNILLDVNNAVYLIDFDKGIIRNKGPWQQKNIKRLKRSLLKLSSNITPFYFSDKNWQTLVAAYQHI